MPAEHLSSAERAAVLRAVRRQREALSSERERLITLDGNLPPVERHQLQEIENELEILSRAVSWLWQQPP